ncbi:DUF1501 domain-containing protein [Gracilimonas amylolytica]|uniref:DUF1501 domain-containing protein n=1 Tax=Gracilimonas amylolytica TaxID=1749045 RepID=UPI000CD7F806|nr:DUF1501 domain-containing protein [Gracilimonas amylolytica]
MDRIKGTSLKDGIHHDHHHDLCSRRDFLSRLGLFATGSALMLSSTPVHALQSSSLFRKLAQLETDKILVLIQLNGGNDGLNTFIPYENDHYYNARPSIAIRKNDVIGLSDTMGMHPALEPLRSIWDDGSMGIIQNVGYPDPILSHFTSSDVWLTSSDSDNIKPSGWLGRYLDGDYIEQELMNQSNVPLAVNIGGSSSLLFKGPDNNTAITFSSVGALDRITQQGQVYSTSNLPDTAFGNEMRFVREQINNSFQYAESIKEAYDKSSNQVDYESRNISMSLQVVARLIKGGLGSKIYMVSLDGFDTHTDQPSSHQNLLQLLSNGIRSFYDDLKAGGNTSEVLTMTFSEFGRRVEQNGQGTDHGTAAPIMLFGDGITPGFFGNDPKLDRDNLDENGNLVYEYDFRSVYTTILTDWFGLSEQETAEVIGREYQKIGFLGSEIPTSNGTDPSIPGTFKLEQNYPNPFNPTTTISFSLPASTRVKLEVFDIQGRRINVLLNSELSAGSHRVRFDASRLASGVYLYKLDAGQFSESKTMTLIK